MNRFVLFLSFAWLVTAEGWSLYQSSSIQRTLYISSSEGNDNNPGTRQFPRRTLSSLSQQERRHSRLLLKCGDIFPERLVSLTGCEVTSYGRGPKPVVTGFFQLRNPSAWEQVSANVWRLDLSQTQDFTGFGYSPPADIPNLGNIGLIYHVETDQVFGHLVPSLDSLQHDGDFFTTETSRRDLLTPETFRHLYFRWPSHPASLGPLCFTSGTYGCVLCPDCYIHDIAIIGFGYNGIQAQSGTTITRCSLDLIGGSILLDYPTGWMRFGNGIEVNVSRQTQRDITVSHNLISRTYDAATTLQGQPATDTSPQNILFLNNTIVHCRQAFEWYINPRTPDLHPRYVRCAFQGNLLLANGDNQFRLPTTASHPSPSPETPSMAATTSVPTSPIPVSPATRSISSPTTTSTTTSHPIIHPSLPPRPHKSKPTAGERKTPAASTSLKQSPGQPAGSRSRYAASSPARQHSANMPDGESGRSAGGRWCRFCVFSPCEGAESCFFLCLRIINGADCRFSL